MTTGGLEPSPQFVALDQQAVIVELANGPLPLVDAEQRSGAVQEVSALALVSTAAETTSISDGQRLALSAPSDTNRPASDHHGASSKNAAPPNHINASKPKPSEKLSDGKRTMTLGFKIEELRFSRQIRTKSFVELPTIDRLLLAVGQSGNPAYDFLKTKGQFNNFLLTWVNKRPADEEALETQDLQTLIDEAAEEGLLIANRTGGPRLTRAGMIRVTEDCAHLKNSFARTPDTKRSDD
jgi:hypothetical protein